MREWLEQFLTEIEEIQLFYETQYEEYAQEFDILKETYIKRKQAPKIEQA